MVREDFNKKILDFRDIVPKGGGGLGQIKLVPNSLILIFYNLIRS